MKHFSNRTRAIVFIVSAAAVILFGLIGASWSNPALAQGTNSVQPLVTPVASEVVRIPGTAGAPCNSPSLLLNDTLGKLIASAVVVPSPSTAICTLLQVVPESNASFPTTFPEFQIPATGLFGAGSTNIPGAPGGYTRITDSVQFAGPISGNKVRMCFVLPTNSSSFKSNRIAYYDTTPGINRWVFLTTKVDTVAGTACMTKGLIKPIPAVFALFGQN